MLRVGIISDVHVGFTHHLRPGYAGDGQIAAQEAWLEYCLRWYKAQGVDVMVIAGDLVNGFDYDRICVDRRVSEAELSRFAAVWESVFGGTPTESIRIYGNHDHLLDENETANGGDRTYWQEAFGEPYTPVSVKEIGGYRFVAAHWGHEAEAAAVLAEAAADGRPVFYIQHPSIKRTVVGSDETCCGQVYDTGLNNVKDYENVVAFSGHSHCVITDERAIWQSAAPDAARCTSVACSTLNYGDMEGHEVNGDDLHTKHGLYMTVEGRDIRIRRLSFWTEEMRDLVTGGHTQPDFARCAVTVGPDWAFTVGGEKVYDTAARKAVAPVPVFADGARAAADTGNTAALITFPAAHVPAENDMVQAYCVVAVDAATGETVAENTVVSRHHVDRSESHLGGCYRVPVWGLKPQTDYEFRVYAQECFGKRSVPLTVRGTTK